MNRKHLQGTLLLAAASLLATSVYAQNPNAAPQAKANAADKAEKAGEKAADKAEKAADKAADKMEKAGDKAADKMEKAGDKAKSGEDRAARKAKEHDAQRDKLRSMLKGPMDDVWKQELRRHAERVAKIERIKAVAEGEKDKATVEKATTLLGKENDRHDKWMAKHAPQGGATGVTGATPTPAADTKGGAK